MGEFELIRQFFSRPVRHVVLGGGDDAALLSSRADVELAVSTDLLVAGRHFLADVDPESLGWKSLAVNLSDLAAMGARPIAFTLGLALPNVDATWLAAFANGLYACAEQFACELVGGDTTRGPLTIAVTVVGDVPVGQAIRRSGAKASDDIWVSGMLGAAALGLAVRQGRIALSADAATRACLALERPLPRVELGEALRGLANAMLDVSDGLVGDLKHVLDSSGVGATLALDAIPMAQALDALPKAQRVRFALAGGDDYELCFTASALVRESVRAAAAHAGVAVTCIGQTEPERGLRVRGLDGVMWAQPDVDALKGYDHFD